MTGLDARVTDWCARHRDLLDAARDPAPLAEAMARELDAPLDDVCGAFNRWLIAETESLARAARRAYVESLRREADAKRARR